MLSRSHKTRLYYVDIFKVIFLLKEFIIQVLLKQNEISEDSGDVVSETEKCLTQNSFVPKFRI